MTASPEQREQWAQKLGALPDTPLKPIGLTAFYAAWLDLKPEEALRSLRRFPDLLHRVSVFDGLSAAIPTSLLPQMLDVISRFTEVERSILIPLYLTALAPTDPIGTARFIDSHPTLVTSADAATLMSAWAGDDIVSAKKWLEAGPFSNKPDVLRALVDAWLTKDPLGARDYVVLHRNEAEFEEAANSVALHLFNRSPEQTRELIMLFKDEQASSILGNLIATANRDQFAKLAMWISTLPSEIAEANLGYALASWATVNPKEALEWVRQKPAAERDRLIFGLIRSNNAPDSAEIVALGFQIRDPQKRDEALSWLVLSLSAESGDATERIRALGLTPFQTKHLLELRRRLPNDDQAPDNH